MAHPFDLRNMDLEKQIRMLRGELASLQELAAERGKNVYDGTSDAVSGYYNDLARVATSLLPGLGKRGRMVGAAAFNHPAAVAAVGLLVVGLVASLFLTQDSLTNPARPSQVSGNGRDQELLPKAQLLKEPLTQEMPRLEAPSVRMAPRGMLLSQKPISRLLVTSVCCRALNRPTSSDYAFGKVGWSRLPTLQPR